MYASFNRFEIQITKDQARQGAHQGECYQDVKALLDLPKIRRQFKKIDPDKIREELKEYGAWDKEQLSDDEENRIRILWIACGNVKEENGL